MEPLEIKMWLQSRDGPGNAAEIEISHAGRTAVADHWHGPKPAFIFSSGRGGCWIVRYLRDLKAGTMG